jgi:hypothetical protein
LKDVQTNKSIVIDNYSRNHCKSVQNQHAKRLASNNFETPPKQDLKKRIPVLNNLNKSVEIKGSNPVRSGNR